MTNNKKDIDYINRTWLVLPFLMLLVWWAFKRGTTDRRALQPQTVAVASNTPTVATTDEDCTLKWIYFDFNSADLRAETKAELDKMAAILVKNNDYTALLRAHADKKGGDSFNDALSNKRALHAKAYLTSLGIEEVRIKTSVAGEVDPVATNDETDKGRQFNRRIELYIQDKNGKNMCSSVAGVPDEVKVK
jgi:outer membrane protein OmpA-like peptidoglycan-associated protein